MIVTDQKSPAAEMVAAQPAPVGGVRGGHGANRSAMVAPVASCGRGAASPVAAELAGLPARDPGAIVAGSNGTSLAMPPHAANQKKREAVALKLERIAETTGDKAFLQAARTLRRKMPAGRHAPTRVVGTSGIDIGSLANVISGADVSALLSLLAARRGVYGFSAAVRALQLERPNGRPPKDDTERIKEIAWLLETRKAKSVWQAAVMVARAEPDSEAMEKSLAERLRRKFAAAKKKIPHK